MRILLTNDDGVYSSGIYALAERLSPKHEVIIAAPSRERSAAGRHMSLNNPISAEPALLLDLESIPAYAVSGTPVDCVRLALAVLFADRRPDAVISGINMGPNLCSDILYSGTVGAAGEAALLGLPAIAVSNGDYNPKHLETSAAAAEEALSFIQKHPLPFGHILNVNVPDLPIEQIRGIRACRTGQVEYPLSYEAEIQADGTVTYLPTRGRTYTDDSEGTDVAAVRDGFIAYTPLGFDMTAYRILEGIEL